jgi:Transposase
VQSLLHADETQLFVGIDWGASHQQLCAVDAGGAKRRQVRLAHDVAGSPSSTTSSAGLGHGCRWRWSGPRAAGRAPATPRACGLSGLPADRGRARERYQTASSNDDVFDAFVLADTLGHEHAHWRPLPIPSPALADLRALTRDRDRLLATQQRTEAQLRAILEAYHPAAGRLFSSVDRQITLAFIGDYPTPQAAAVVGEQGMVRFLARTATPAGSSPRCWSSGCAPTCWRARRAPWPARRTRRWSSPSCWGCSTSSWPTTTRQSRWRSSATQTRHLRQLPGRRADRDRGPAGRDR